MTATALRRSIRRLVILAVGIFVVLPLGALVIIVASTMVIGLLMHLAGS